MENVKKVKKVSTSKNREKNHLMKYMQKILHKQICLKLQKFLIKEQHVTLMMYWNDFIYEQGWDNGKWI